jgi:hypothetical protein
LGEGKTCVHPNCTSDLTTGEFMRKLTTLAHHRGCWPNPLRKPRGR